MPLGRSLVVTVLLLSVAGCSPHATRYTWAGDEANLRRTHAACVQEISKEYVPRAHGAGVPVMVTLYKDCMEKHGYQWSSSTTAPMARIMSGLLACVSFFGGWRGSHTPPDFWQVVRRLYRRMGTRSIATRSQWTCFPLES